MAGGRWALLGTTVFPGFEFRDFKLGDRGRLLKQYPKQRATIIALTKEPG
jgi:predicted cupin superfamily sugar epimerase